MCKSSVVSAEGRTLADVLNGCQTVINSCQISLDGYLNAIQQCVAKVP